MHSPEHTQSMETEPSFLSIAFSFNQPRGIGRPYCRQIKSSVSPFCTLADVFRGCALFHTTKHYMCEDSEMENVEVMN